MKISALILAYNEERNIRRTIESVLWADEIVVIDSLSTDHTLDILAEYSKVKVTQRPFDSHTEQWNFGIEQTTFDWILSMDSDYVITEELKMEILSLEINDYSAFSIPFKYLVYGKPLKGTILPPRVALFNKKNSIYIHDGHTQLLKTEGLVRSLKNHIHHDDRKKLNRWLSSQSKYVDLEIEKLRSTQKKLSLVDRIRRKKYFAPFLIFFYCLFVKRGIFDGKRGLFYAFQRVYFELLLSLKLVDSELQKSDTNYYDSKDSVQLKNE